MILTLWFIDHLQRTLCLTDTKSEFTDPTSGAFTRVHSFGSLEFRSRTWIPETDPSDPPLALSSVPPVTSSAPPTSSTSPAPERSLDSDQQQSKTARVPGVRGPRITPERHAEFEGQIAKYYGGLSSYKEGPAGSVGQRSTKRSEPDTILISDSPSTCRQPTVSEEPMSKKVKVAAKSDKKPKVPRKPKQDPDEKAETRIRLQLVKRLEASKEALQSKVNTLMEALDSAKVQISDQIKKMKVMENENNKLKTKVDSLSQEAIHRQAQKRQVPLHDIHDPPDFVSGN